MNKPSIFDLGREDYRNGEIRLRHYPERAAGWDAEKKAASFPSAKAAHVAAAARNSEEMKPGGRGGAMGWAVVSLLGGGFAVRLGYAKGSPIILPENAVRERLLG